MKTITKYSQLKLIEREIQINKCQKEKVNWTVHTGREGGADRKMDRIQMRMEDGGRKGCGGGKLNDFLIG